MLLFQHVVPSHDITIQMTSQGIWICLSCLSYRLYHGIHHHQTTNLHPRVAKSQNGCVVVFPHFVWLTWPSQKNGRHQPATCRPMGILRSFRSSWNGNSNFVGRNSCSCWFRLSSDFTGAVWFLMGCVFFQRFASLGKGEWLLLGVFVCFFAPTDSVVLGRRVNLCQRPSSCAKSGVPYGDCISLCFNMIIC